MVTSGSWFSSHPVWLLDHPHVRRSAVHGQRTGGRGVHDASGRVVAGGGRPTLAVDLTEYADIAEIRQTSEDRVVGHARQAFDDPGLRVDIELRPGMTRSAGRGVL